MEMTETNKKYAKIFAGVVASGLILYFIFRKTDEKYDPTGNPDYIPAQPIFNAKSISESLHEAMDRVGTETDTILETLKTVTQAQFTQVAEAFGKKPYNTVTGNSWNPNPFSELTKLPLKTWLKEELSVKDYAILKLKYPYAL